jgi:hypothetical protein
MEQLETGNTESLYKIRKKIANRINKLNREIEHLKRDYKKYTILFDQKIEEDNLKNPDGRRIILYKKFYFY